MDRRSAGVDRWRQGWLPWYNVARAHFEAGHTYRIKLEWSKDQGIETMRLQWKTPASSSATSLWSEVGDGDRLLLRLRPDLDAVVGGYREVTGQAPMMPRWAFGSGSAVSATRPHKRVWTSSREFRATADPLDCHRPGLQYWPLDSWGSHAFDAHALS